ncbi:MAG: lipoyl(octanoyl) transferase LipB [Chitinophagia bacterium]|nr:lipoyl(octanoyl) transferase LipB [Chitinophagia bacterium]
MNTIAYQDLGCMGYEEAWALQEALLSENLTIKQRFNEPNRHLPVQTLAPTSHHLLFCSHPHVYTLGKSGHIENLLISNEVLQQLGVTFVKTNRGGDITYHGPGQIVGYPILDLEHFFTDLSRYMRSLEEVIILTMAEYGIEAGRLPGSTGVWLAPDNAYRARKICAMGVRSSRWITMHGFALNVNTDLSFFNHIVPCGIVDNLSPISAHLSVSVLPYSV